MDIGQKTKRWTKRIGVGAILVIALLIAARLALPWAIKNYVNRTLDRLPDYDGQIDDVDVALFRGAYTIDNVRIVKTTGKVPEPLFSAQAVDLSIQWGALFEGKWVGEIEIDHGALNFVNAPTSAQAQTAVSNEWLSIVKDLFPLRLNRFQLTDSIITYNDHHSDPAVRVELDDVNVVGKNFSNTRSPVGGQVASIDGTANFEHTAPVKLISTLEPAASKPTFTMELSLTSLPVPRLNDFLRAYGNVDAEKGMLSVYTEIEAREGKLRGYVKPIIKDLKIFSFKKDSSSVFGAVWQAIVGTVLEIFENHRHDQIATRIELGGTFEKVDTSTLQTLWGIFKNAFIEAFKPGWEKSLTD